MSQNNSRISNGNTKQQKTNKKEENVMKLIEDLKVK